MQTYQQSLPNRPKTTIELISLSFQYYLSNFYIWIFYFGAFTIFFGYILTIENMGYPTSAQINTEEITNLIINPDQPIDFSSIMATFYQTVFVFFNERISISIFLAVAYAISIPIVYFSIQNDPRRIFKEVATKREGEEDSDLQSKGFFTVSKLKTRLIHVVIVSLILNLGIALGQMLFVIPGLVVSVLFSLVPVVVMLEHDKNIFQSFGRSMELLKGFFFRTLVFLFAIGLIQFIFTLLIRTIIISLLFSDRNFDDPQTYLDPLIRYFSTLSESFFAPLTITSIIVLYLDVKAHPKQPFYIYQKGYPQQQYYQPSGQTSSFRSTISPRTQVPPPSSQEKKNQIFCMWCGKPNPMIASFCAFCGKNLQKELLKPSQTSDLYSKTQESSNVCSNCGKPPLKEDDKFCQYCGYKYS